MLLPAALLASLLAAAPARASFDPIELQSVGLLEQFQEAGESAISANGRYMAFQGSVGGVQGIWRKELTTGKLELVTGGSIYSGSKSLTEALAPSISEEGRYVSFTSPAQLTTSAHTGRNVYVRDMTVAPAHGGGPCSEAQEGAKECPYELASALNGGSEGLTYSEDIAYGGRAGAVASGRISLSANGREIVFVTTGSSDLTSANAAELSTPPLQVVVRYLAPRDETVLVSAEREPVGGQMTGRPVAEGAVTPSPQMSAGGSSVLPGAALSGDGSTVAWLGADIPAQAPTLNGEREQIEHDDHASDQAYDEPLWRRIADGPSAAIRRVVGGGDPLAPGCPPDGTIEVPACQGPYPDFAWDGDRGGEEGNYGWLGIDSYDGVPQLSEDGLTVALIGDPDSTSNVFVVNMREGLDRVQALRQLTREVPVSEVPNPGIEAPYVASAGDVYEVAISPNGRRIAFTTQRQQFPLAPPNFTEPPPPVLGVVELYEIDLEDESLVRVTHGPDDGPSLGGNQGTVTSSGASTPSFTHNGLTLAFADTASNLVFGDANDASDVFTVTEEPTSETAGSVSIGPPPPGREPAAPQWRLDVVAVTHPNGSVTLDALVPAAGRLRAAATATVPVAARATAKKASAARGHRAARIAKGGQRSGKRSLEPTFPGKLKTKTIATAQMPTAASGLLELPLRAAPSYASLLRASAGVYATVRVIFTGAGGPPLSQTLAVTLHQTVPSKAHKSKSASKHVTKAGRRAKNEKAK